MTINPVFPIQGETPWGPKLNLALGQIVTAINANEPVVLVQAVPSASWSFAVPYSFTRAPSVQVRDDAGTVIFADTTATSSLVTVQFPTATTGSVVLT